MSNVMWRCTACYSLHPISFKVCSKSKRIDAAPLWICNCVAGSLTYHEYDEAKCDICKAEVDPGSISNFDDYTGGVKYGKSEVIHSIRHAIRCHNDTMNKNHADNNKTLLDICSVNY